MDNNKNEIENPENKIEIKENHSGAKEINKSFCSYCSREVELVWVHSHYQCPNCKNVVVSCCGDN